GAGRRSLRARCRGGVLRAFLDGISLGPTAGGVRGGANMSAEADASHTERGFRPGLESPQLELSVVIPCLNEAETLASCVRKALGCMREHGIRGEVVVADNGSTDGSPEIAAHLGARVVHVDRRGYGSALVGGIEAGRGTYGIMGHADDSYDFTQLLPFLSKLREGYDLVMGNRFKGGIEPGAMPPLHRYVGNPLLTGIGRFLFRSPVGDFHCGLRGFR